MGEENKCLAKKFAIFLIGIISVVSLIVCQKANVNQSNVSDTEETKNTVLEMEMNENYSSSDPFENGRLFCVSEDIETLDVEVYFQMNGESGIVEIKDRNADEVLWSNTWADNVSGDTVTVSLNNLQDEWQTSARQVRLKLVKNFETYIRFPKKKETALEFDDIICKFDKKVMEGY